MNEDIVTIVIKTFNRPKCLDRLVKSIRKYYSDIKIIVGDDSFCKQPRTDVEHILFEPDIGMSAGRNNLVKLVKTPYFLLLDDDYEFTEETKIETLLKVLQGNKDIPLAAGKKIFINQPNREGFHYLLEEENGILFSKRKYHEERPDCKICNLVVNFFVAKTDVIINNPWDNTLKVREHIGFFLRLMRKGINVAYVPEVTVLEFNARPENYSIWRNRDEYLVQQFENNGIHTYIDANNIMRYNRERDKKKILAKSINRNAAIQKLILEKQT